jgi:hypothetical protein
MNDIQPKRSRRSRRALALVAVLAVGTPAAAAPWTKILQGLQGNSESATPNARPRTPVERPVRDDAKPSGESSRAPQGTAERAALEPVPAADATSDEHGLAAAATPAQRSRAESGDPTSASAELRALLAAEDAAKAEPTAAAAPVIPEISLRALVVGKGAEPSAIIQFGEGQSHLVRTGREYPLAGGTAQRPASLLVRRITADSIEMEIRPTGQRMLLP